jgi:hypothetical protein
VSTIAVIVIVFVVLVVLLIVGGLVANGRRARGEEDELLASLHEADRALAAARAVDRGWDREAMESAARAAFAARSPAAIGELLLLQVVDRPGMEEDQALFRVVTEAGSEELLLVRDEAGSWHAADPQ